MQTIFSRLRVDHSVSDGAIIELRVEHGVLGEAVIELGVPIFKVLASLIDYCYYLPFSAGFLLLFCVVSGYLKWC